MSASTIVLYHGPACPDGFGAAWASSLALGRGPDVAYIPVNYGQPYPAEIDGGVSRLFILDFSYPRPIMEKLAGLAGEIVVLDHHKSAQVELEGLPYARFDMGKSGAVLAWEHFRPGEPVPTLIRYVQDRDLWRWELPHSREISAALSIEPRDFGRWDRIADDLNHPNPAEGFCGYVERGTAILASRRQQVESLVSHAAFTEVGGHAVPTVNTPLLQSEVGEALCEKFPDSPFSATFFVRVPSGGIGFPAEETVWSLRSRNGFDVSEVARALGGGGHRAASGFVRKREGRI